MRRTSFLTVRTEDLAIGIGSIISSIPACRQSHPKPNSLASIKGVQHECAATELATGDPRQTCNWLQHEPVLVNQAEPGERLREAGASPGDQVDRRRSSGSLECATRV